MTGPRAGAAADGPGAAAPVDSPLVSRLVALAVEEDAAFGDVTSEYCIPEGHVSAASVVAREPLVLCGTALVSAVFRALGSDAVVTPLRVDGDRLDEGDVAVRVEGRTRHVLAAERTALNFLQRLSGVATHTRRVVEGLPAGFHVLDTRKTTPGYRLLEKYATAVGGARNHRRNLSEMVLIKNNHIDASGGDVAALFSRLRATAPWYVPVQCEVRSAEELEAVLPHGPDSVMFDNMDDAGVARCLELVRASGRSVKVEVSGSLTPERLPRLSALGVTVVSMGGLTGRAGTVDISLRVDPR